MADGPYRVVGVAPTTVTVKIGDKRERLSLKRVVKDLKPDAHIRYMVLKDGIVSTEKTETPVDAEVSSGSETMDPVNYDEENEKEESTESTTVFIFDRIIDHHFTDQGTR